MSFKRFAFALVLGVLAAGCAANLDLDKKIVAVVGGRDITYGEFKREYALNTVPDQDSSNSVASKKHFLDLLVNYNLKLLDAKKENLLNEPATRSEMENYETQLAVSYILEHELTDPTVKEIYERQKEEVRAKEVFIQIRPDSLFPAGDTLKAYDEALSVIKDVQAGAPIDSLIRLYRGGDTYYITAGNYLQYPGGAEFENMLYTLKPGEVSPLPIRTAYGYLVVKLEDRRPRVMSIRASHILIKIAGNTPGDTLKAYDKAVAVLDSAKEGIDFAKLAMDNSADSVSARRGGDLGFFTRGMMVHPFEEAAFNLKNIGDIAGPVRTQFGYHIIKLTGITPVPPYEDMKNQIRTSFLNGGYKLAYESFVDGLKRSFSFKENDSALSILYEKANASAIFGDAKFDSLLTPDELSMPAFTFDNETETIDTILSIAKGESKYSSYPMSRPNLEKIVGEVSGDIVLDHYAVAKARTYPEFDSLITKYEDGILIYQIEQERVWNKVGTGDSVLKPYYTAHAGKYLWPPRVDLSMIEVANKNLADSLYGLLKSGANFDTLASRFNSDKDLKVKGGEWGLFADSSNSLVIAAFRMKEGEFSEPLQYEGSYSIIRVNRFVPSEQKTFDEARGEVAADYQEYESRKLQHDWIESLKKEFGVKIDEKTFDELVARE